MSELKNTNNYDRLLSFPFNLHPVNALERCKGEIVLKEEKLQVVVDEKLENEIDTSEIDELISETGVGCLYVSYRKKDDKSVHLLCRTDSKLSKKAIKTPNYALDPLA